MQRIAGDVDLYSHQYDRPSCDPYQTRSACAVWEMLSDQLRLLHPCASAYVAALVASAKLKERRHTYYANTLYYNCDHTVALTVTPVENVTNTPMRVLQSARGEIPKKTSQNRKKL